jgi:uncharacterized membrane protein YeaQ/YmgE (transglycosylase-associated protein family)
MDDAEYRLAFSASIPHQSERDRSDHRASQGATRRVVRRPTGEGVLDMGILSWIILGLIAGWIASKIVNKTGSGMFMDIALGVVGAIVGGILAGLVGLGGVTGVNIGSIIIAVIGAVIVLWVYHKFVEAT